MRFSISILAILILGVSVAEIKAQEEEKGTVLFSKSVG